MDIKDYVKLVKLSDDKFGGAHPNNVYVGMTVYGEMINNVKVGESLMLTNVRGEFYGWFHTSPIVEIIDENTFKTLNSTYHIELCDKTILISNS